MENVVLPSGHLEYFATTVYILGAFGNFLVIWYFAPVLVYCTKKNLATLGVRKTPKRYLVRFPAQETITC
jgi:hypothetical protein